MTTFPQTIHFTGLNTPVRTETSIRNLPVIGALMRSNAFQRNETELVIVITQ